MNLQDLRQRLRRAWRFASEDVWDIELTSLSSLHRFGVNVIRVVQLVFRGFREDECPLHASAMTFSTLMAIVPVLALSLALARGLGDEAAAKQLIRDRISDWTETFRVEHAESEGTEPKAAENGEESTLPDEQDSLDLAAQIDSLVEKGFEKVENISFGALSGVGLILLIWTVIQVLGRVESSFNKVWGVTEGRSVWRKTTDYLSVIFITPVLAIAASSFPVADFATRFLDEGTAQVVRSFLGSGFLRQVTVIGMTTLCFSFVIAFMPNTRVRALPGLTGGFVTALLFIGWLSLCAALQVGAARAGKIYGSFAVVPILLAWVYVSWQIVLFGTEVAFAVQNCTTYQMEQGATRANINAKILLALSVVTEIGRLMKAGDEMLHAPSYAREKRIPIRFLNEVLSELKTAGLVGELAEEKDRFVLLRSPSELHASDVVEVMLTAGVGPSQLGLDSIGRNANEILKEAMKGLEGSLRKTTVEQLVEAGGQMV